MIITEKIKRICRGTAILAAGIIFCLVVPAADTGSMYVHAEELTGSGEKNFEDVSEGAYYYDAVRWAVKNEVTSGTSETTFSPGDKCTRAQTVTFLWRVMGKPESTLEGVPFTDVDKNAYYYPAVLWAYENKITSGTSADTFEPDGQVTRGQFVTFLWRMEGSPTAAAANFTDASGAYYTGAVNWAYANGITTGTGNNQFSPLASCLRGQVVTFIYRWKTSVKASDFGALPGDDTDDTPGINSAISKACENGGGTVVLSAGTYRIDALTGINMKSNVTLSMDSATVLDVYGNSEGGYCVIKFDNVSNAGISGGTLAGERNKHSGTSGEWGHGIGIYDSSNVKITGMTIQDNWGDGIYMGTGTYDDTLYGCDGVTISNCTIKSNRRSNMSIVDASNVTVDSCYIANADGTAPRCGINIEPNRNSQGVIPNDAICRNITISNTTIDTLKRGDIYGQYFCFMTISYGGAKVISCENINITNCRFNGDSGNFSGKNCTIRDSSIAGVFYDEADTTLVNTSCGQYYKEAPVYLSDGLEEDSTYWY